MVGHTVDNCVANAIVLCQMEYEENAMNQQIVSRAERLAYSLDEVAKMTGLSVSFLRLEVTRGRLRASRAGRRVLVSANELRSYLEPETERTTR